MAKSYTTVCFDYCLSVAFLNIDRPISQDSAAPCLRCGGIFKNDFIANLPLSLRVKKFENRLTFGEVTGKSMVSCFFLTGGVDCVDSAGQLVNGAPAHCCG